MGENLTQSICIERFISPFFEENMYLVYLDQETDQKSDDAETPCFVIDPGANPRPLLAKIRKKNLRLETILFTHGHADHVAGALDLLEAFPNAQLGIGRADADMLTSAAKNLSESFGIPIVLPKADLLFDDEDTPVVAKISLRVRHIPGHTPGHVVYILPTAPSQVFVGAPPRVFVGDTVFRGSIGRSDFPGGDGNALIEAIQSRILTLPDDTILLCGHGDETTVAREKKSNPFLR